MSSEASTEKKISTRTKLIIAGVAFLLITAVAVLIYYNGRAAGKRKGGINISTTPTDPGGSTASASNAEISTIASDLWKDMEGANFFGHNLDPWKRWLALSDTDFIRVGNAFNEGHEKSSGQTIRQWVDAEQNWTNPAWSQLKNISITRMDKLRMQ